MVALFSVAAGMAQVFGEITNLSFLKSLPPELIGGWGAGTGIAGILGSGIYILLNDVLNFSNCAVFALMLLTLPVYWCCFMYLHKEATKGLEGRRLAMALGGGSVCQTVPESPTLPSHDGLQLHLAQSDPEEQPETGSTQPKRSSPAPATWGNIKLACQYSGSIMFNLVAVYALEYIIYPGLDDRETLCSEKSWYTIMWMCYNVGVTMSRFSVTLFRIKRVWLLTLFQFANVVGWTIEIETGVIRNAFSGSGGLLIMAGWMVVVGLCGGATYANCMYLFSTQEGIPNNLRELGINLGFIMSNIGITTATFSFQILDQGVLTKSRLYPGGC